MQPSVSGPASTRAPTVVGTLTGARWALGILLSINLVNYLDRYVLSAVLQLIKRDIGATDTQMGALASAFMVVYMCAAVPIGYFADRSDRRKWISFGVFSWSLATLGSGISATYRQLFVSRSAVGIGESCYGSVSPSFVAEYFPKEKQAGAMALFSMAIPVGSALGYILGGLISQRWGWRQAFFIAGIPGLILTLLAYRLKDPRTLSPASMHLEKAAAPKLPEYFQLRHNKSFVSCTLAMAAMTFGLGGFAVWMPAFFMRSWSLDVEKANIYFGGLTVIAGFAGSLCGGWLADRFYKITTKSYFLVSGLGLIAAFPLSFIVVLTHRLGLSLTALFLAEFCAWLNMGPLNALIVSVTSSRVRSMAFAANILIIHLLGDAVSPTIIGWISDMSSLRYALLFAATGLALGGGICLWGMRYLQADTQSAQSHA